MTMTDTPSAPLPTCGNRDCTLSECQPVAPSEAPTFAPEAPPAPPAPTTMPTRSGATGAPDGAAFMNAAAARYDWRDIPPATVSDMLAAIRERVETDADAARSLARTMRAYGREQASEMRQFGPRFREMIAGGELQHPAWFEWSEVPSEWPIDPLDTLGRPTDAARVLTLRTAPDTPTALAYGATVRDIVAAWCEVRDILSNDVEALAEALADAATDNGWCPVYDRLCSDLNGYLPSHIAARFVRREPPETVWEATGTLTITIPLGGTYYATPDADQWEHGREALQSSADDVLYDLRRRLNYSISDWSVEVEDYSDTGERAD